MVSTDGRADSPPSYHSVLVSSSTMPLPAPPDIKPSNFIKVSREGEIVGQWVVDADMNIMHTSSAASTDRRSVYSVASGTTEGIKTNVNDEPTNPNLLLKSAKGSLEARVYVLPTTGDLAPTDKVTIKVEAEKGWVMLRVHDAIPKSIFPESTTPPTEERSRRRYTPTAPSDLISTVSDLLQLPKSPSFQTTTPLPDPVSQTQTTSTTSTTAPTPTTYRRLPIHIHTTTKSLEQCISIPRSFHGALLIRTPKTLFCSNAISACKTPFSESDNTHLFFVSSDARVIDGNGNNTNTGGREGGGHAGGFRPEEWRGWDTWAGDKVEVVADNAMVFLFYDDEQTMGVGLGLRAANACVIA